MRCNLLESDANHFLHWLPFLTITRSMPQRVNWACRAEASFQSPNLHQARMGTSSSVLKLQRQTKLSIILLFLSLLELRCNRGQHCWDIVLTERGLITDNKTIHAPIPSPPRRCCFLQVAPRVPTAAQHCMEQSRTQSLLAVWSTLPRWSNTQKSLGKRFCVEGMGRESFILNFFELAKC